MRPLEYISLTDFSPGIFSAGWSWSSNPTPAPLGAARDGQTWRCIAGSAGGLIPLPTSTNYNLPEPEANPVNARWIINGCRLINLGYANEIHYGMTWLQNATLNQRFQWRREVEGVGTSTMRDITNAPKGSGTGWTPQVWSTCLTRLTDAGDVGNITIASSWPQTLDPAGAGYIWFWPDPAASNTNTPFEINTNFGLTLAHQSRVMLLRAVGGLHGPADFSLTNEAIDYTDPPQSTTMGTQRTFIAPEAPHGYGMWGSISAGELLLVKHHRGAVMMYDDIVYPRVVRLPGVAGTNGFVQEGSFCSLGLVYISRGDGVYAWNGSNTAVKISPQLDPFVFEPPLLTSANPVVGMAQPVYPFVQHAPWLDRVIFPNNYLYDPSLQSWWRLENPATFNGVWWTSMGVDLWGFVGEWATGATNNMRKFSVKSAGGVSLNLASSYQWVSQPIPISVGKVLDVREVELLAQPGPAGGGTVTITILNHAGGVVASNAFTLTASIGPQRQIWQLPNPIECSDFAIKIEANSGGSTSAPAIWAVNVGYHQDRVTGSHWR